MPDKDDSQLGLYAGVLAGVMVVALSVMAFLALDPAPMQMAQADKATIEAPHLETPEG